MNKSYKTIWNESLGAWVAASELATGRSKSSRSRKATRAVLAAGLLLQAGVMAPAVAGALDGGDPTTAVDQQAYGYKAQVTTDAPAMAIGSNVSAGAGQAIAIGYGVTNNAIQSIVMGSGITLDANSGGSVVFQPSSQGTNIGRTQVSRSSNSFVFINAADPLDANTVTNSGSAVAIGATLTNASSSVGIGPKAKVTAGTAVAIGAVAQALGTSAVSVGFGALASGAQNTAIGNVSTASGAQSSALGVASTASGGQSVAVGVNSKASNTNALAAGNTANAAGNSALAVGANTLASLANTVAVGNNARATGGNALSVGNASAASGTDSTAAGPSATASGGQSVAVGVNSTASNTSAVAAGNGATASGNSAVAVGAAAQATNDYASAVGPTSTASGVQSLAVGYLSKATNLNTVALGTGANAGGSSAVSIGDGSQAAGTQAVGVGYFSKVSGNNSGAIGTNNSVAANNAFVMGNNITVGAGLAGTVVLGNGSAAVAATPVTNVILSGTTYNFAGTAPTSTVSVGAAGAERQITNVAAGRVSNTSTDAVNGSQLNATNLAVTNLAANGVPTKYFHANSSGADSVPTGANSIAIGPDAVSGGANSMAAGQGAQSAGQLAVAVGANANASAFGASALGVNSKATGGSATALGNSAVAAGNSAAALGESANATGTNAVAVGASAKASSDYALAVGASANASAFAASAIGVNSKATGNSAVALGNGASASNVNAMAMGTSAVASGASALTVGESSSATGSRSAAFGNSARALADDTLAAGSSANASGLQSVAIGSLTTATKINGVALGASADATGAAAIAVGAGAGASGDGSAAFGVNSAASGERSVALGASANASAFGASALGVNTKATGGSATALGNSASAAGNSAAAVGESANASGTNAVAVGASAKANSDYAVAVGSTSNASGLQSLAVGYLSKASNANAVAVGPNAKASGATSAALGGNSAASGDQSVALGANANASAFGASALGVNSNAIGGSATALGNSASAAGNSTVALGESAKTSSNFALAVGASSNASGLQSLAVGYLSKASNTNAVAVGAGANAAGSSGVSVGANSAARLDNAVAVGNNANAAGNNAAALGNAAAASGLNALAAGASSTASGDQSVAVGINSKASNTSALALGNSALASGTQSIAIGNGAQATGTQSLSVGTGNKVSGNNSGAFGDPNAVTGAGSYAFGNDNTIAANNAFVMGNNVSVGSSLTGTVVLGNGSAAVAATPVTGTTINGIGYAFAGTAPTSTVSVGAAGAERQITNVAAGRLSNTSTDAVNGSQLFATNQAVDKLVTNGAPTKYFHANSAQADSIAQGAESVAIGPKALANGSNSIAMGNNANASGIGDVAIGANSTAANGVNPVTGQVLRGVAIGENSIAAGGVAVGEKANAGLGSTALGNGSVAAAGGVAIGSRTDLPTSATGNASVAVGALANASGESAVVLGVMSSASNANTIAIGSLSNVSGSNSAAVGTSNKVASNNAFVLGNNVTVGTGLNGAVVLGNNSTAAAAQATTGTTINGKAYTFAGTTPAAGDVVSVGAVGAERQITNVAAGRVIAGSTDAVNGSQLYATNTELSNVGAVVTNITNGGGIKYFRAKSTAADSQALGTDSVAIGPAAVASGTDSIAMGVNANASAFGASAIGVNSNATGGSATALGNSATATGNSAVALGESAKATSNFALAAGASSNASGLQSLAVGYLSKASNTNAVALGTNADASAFGASAMGVNATASGGSSIAVGNSAKASDNSAMAMGTNANASGNSSTALGEAANASGSKAVAMGSSAKATDNYALAVGASSNASGLQSLAVGYLSKASQLNAVALGTGANAGGISSVSIGDGSQAAGTQAVGVGYFSRVTGNNSGAIGSSNTVVANNAFVVGNNITVGAGLDGAVVLGDKSTVAASNPTANATVNGKNYTFAGAAPAAGGVVSVGAVGAERQITNVAAGRLSGTSTDAVNGSQLYATNTELSNVGSVVNNISNGGGIKYFKANSTLADSQAQGLDSVAIGPNAVAKNASDVALGNGSVTDTAVATAGATINNKAVTFAGSAPTSTVSVGSVGAERTITNVAAGRLSGTSTDAVNGSQLYATNNELSNVGSTVTTITNGGGIKYFRANSTLADSQAQGLDSVAIGPNAVATKAGDVALGNGSVTDTAVATAGATINGKAVTFAGNAPTSTVSVGSVGAERTITNVAAGQLTASSTDAVNGSQLYATNTELSNVGSTVTTITNGGGIKYFRANSTMPDSQAQGLDSVAIGPNAVAKNASDVALGNGSVTDTAVATAGATINGKAVTFAGSAPTSTVSVGALGAERTITNVAAGQLTASSTDAINGSQLYATNNELSNVGSTVTTITNGGGIKYFRANSTLADSQAQGLDSVAIGPNAVAKNASDVALGNGSVTDTAVATTGATINGKAVTFAGNAPTSTVSVGSVGAERTITNVAAGQLTASSTDAVNGSQLYATNNELSNVGSTVTTITNGGGIKYFRANSTLADSQAQGLDSVAIGPNAVAKNASDVALGNGSVTDTAVATAGATINGKAVTFAGNAPTSTVSVGAVGSERTITNVAAGQLTASSTDAVNGSQLYATNNELSNVGSTVTTITNGGGIKYFRANSTMPDSQAQGLDSVAIGPNAVAKNASDVALGNGSVTDTTVATAGATINGKAVTFAGNAPTSTVSVGSVGAERTITNVAAGQLTASSTDAVNGSQLYATNNELSNVGSTVTTITNGGGIKYFRANSTLADSQAQGLDSVAIGPNAVAKNASDVALGNGSVTDTAVATAGATINNKAVTFAGSAPTSTVSVGSVGAERTITNVAAGRLSGTSTDAVNGSQLYATNNELSNVGSTVTTITNGGGIKYFRANSTLADSQAQGQDSVAIGPNAVAKNASDVALGNSSVTDTAVATAGATINGKAVTFAGNAPTSTVSVGAVGSERTITNVAAGRLTASSTDAVNGSQLYATNNELSNVGSTVTTITNGGGIKYFRANSTLADSQAQGLDSVAIGPNAVAKNASDVALGNGSVTDTAVATAGATINGKAVTFAGSTPTSTVSVGSAGAERTITNVAAGRLSSSSTDAVNGSQLYATNNELSKVGSTVTTITNGGGIKYFRANSTLADSQAQGLDSVAIGPNAVAKNASDVALGNGSVTDTAVATAGATINGKAVTFAGTAPTSTVSVGSVGAERTITNVAAGQLSTTSTDAVNGSQLYATNTELSNVGTTVTNITNGGGIKYFRANSSGNDSQALALDSVAIGPNAVANREGDVALGSGSITSTSAPTATAGATINGNAYTFAGAAPTSTVSVGSVGAERTITNVAAGRLSANSTDAVNGSQLYATNEELTKVGTTVTNINNGAGIKYFRANSTGADSQAQGLDSVAIGPNAVAAGEGDVALGSGSKANGATGTTGAIINGNAYTFAGNAPTSTVSVGDVGEERTITNVAAGRLSLNSTDAVNGSQLFATNIEVGLIGTTVKNINNGAGIKYFHANSTGADSKAQGPDSVAIGPNAVANSGGGVALGAGSVANTAAGVAGYIPPSADTNAASAILATKGTQGAVSVGDAANGIYRQINGVAAGTLDSDAVNVAQLKAVSASVSTAGDKWIVGSPTTYKAPTSTGANGTAVGSGASVTADNSVAVGTGAAATTANSVALGNGSTTAAATASTGVTLQGNTYTFAGGAPVGVVSVGSAGQERQITNVAAGQLNANSTDAVNGSQLYATNQALNNIQGGAGIKYFHANSAAADSNAVGAESVAIGPQALSTGAGSVAMGNGAKSNAANSVAVGAGSIADRTGMAGQKELFSNTVVNSTQGAMSVGSAGNERQITHVAGGTEATDAVNVRQLQAVKAGSVQYDTNVDGSVNQNSITLGGSSSSATAIHNVAAGVAGTDAANVDQVKQMGQDANAYTDVRSNQLRADIQTTAKDASAGTAGAMAMAGMPQASIPGKSMWTAGAAAYDGQAAIAIGVSKLADNGRWVIKFSGSANSRGKTGVSVGAGFHW